MDGLNILIIDDDVGDTKLIRRCLSKSRFACNIFEASRASEAYAMDSLKPDAVLIDYRLPGEDGLGLLGHLREKWPRAAFILISGQGDEDIAKSAIIAGATDYVSKKSISDKALEDLLGTSIETARRRWKQQEHQEELATFSDVLVHDFRAPIRAVMMLTDQIQQDFDEGCLEDMVDSVRLLRTAAGQMSELVDSLAEHVRFDRSEERSCVPARHLADRALIALSQVIEESDAEITIDGGEFALECSAPQMSQLVQNIIANAIKYSGDNRPKITISIGLTNDQLATFRITDNGIGVPAEFRERIFEPFKRVPGAARPFGTGLGLATCRKIMDRHKGQIWCEPGQDGGTRIVFQLSQTVGGDTFKAAECAKFA